MLTFSYHNIAHVNGADFGQVSVLSESFTVDPWEYVGSGSPPASWKQHGYPLVLFPDEDTVINMVFQPEKPHWLLEGVVGDLYTATSFKKYSDNDQIVYNEKATEHTNFDGWVTLAGAAISDIAERKGYIQRRGTNFRLPVAFHGYTGVDIILTPGDSFIDSTDPGYEQRWRCDYVSKDPSFTLMKLETPVSAGRKSRSHYVWTIQFGINKFGEYGYKWKREVDNGSQGIYDKIVSSPWPTPPYGGTLQPLSYINDKIIDPSRAESIVKRFIGGLDNLYGLFEHPSEVDIYGELANQCTSEYKRIDANVPSTVVETVGTASEVIDLIQGVKDVFHAKGAARFIQALGNLKLSVQWGLPLTVSDLKSISYTTSVDIAEGRYLHDRDEIIVARRRMERQCPGRGPLAHLTASCRWSLKTIVKSNAVAQEHQYARMMADYNVISLENAWDMVPYSFVVDWLTDFGDIVAGTDNLLYRTFYYDIIGSVRGRRLFVHLDSQAIQGLEPLLTGEVDLVLYRRFASHTIPLPSYGFLTPEVGLDQWIDGAILIGQQLIS